MANARKSHEILPGGWPHDGCPPSLDLSASALLATLDPALIVPDGRVPLRLAE